MNSEEILEEAIKILERDGWVQGDLYEVGGDPTTAPVCAVGAINRATWGSANICTSTAFRDAGGRRLAIDRLSEAIGRSSIGSWNDRPERTKEDVILAMKRAIHEVALYED